MNKTFIGVVIALIFSGLIILSIENDYSSSQIFIGFIVFIIPSIFLSSFKSTALSIILTVICVLFVYFSIHFKFYNTWVGVLMALTIGLPIYYYRVRNAKVQDGHKGST